MSNQDLQFENNALQNDLNQSRSDYTALLEAVKKVMAECDQQRKQIAELEAANQRLCEMLWGRRSERRLPDKNQPLLPEAVDWFTKAEQEATRPVDALSDEEQAKLDAEIINAWKQRQANRATRRSGSQKLPDHLEVRETVLDLTPEQKVGLKELEQEVTDQLCLEKPVIYIRRTIRRRYVALGEPERGVIAPLPKLSIVPGCRYDFSVIAAVIGMKFAFHQPTYRQQDWLAQFGWFPNRSTINDLINLGAATVEPLVGQVRHLLLQQPYLLIDETRLRLLTRDALTDAQREQLSRRKKSPSKTGKPRSDGCVNSYAWLFTGLPDFAPYNLFHWSLTRQQTTVDDILSDFHGTVIADAYDAYAHIAQRTTGRILHGSCNTHARREFIKAETYEPILASQMISFYHQLFTIETRAAIVTAEQRLAMRQREAEPIWQRMEQWLKSTAVQDAALPSSPFGKAVGYLTNQWDALRRYLTDGNLPISNDQAEQIIRPLTVGRRNWLFLGHPDAAPGRMNLLTIVSSAHRHHLMLDAYLVDVLTKLAEAKQRHPQDLELNSPYLLDLLPDRWAAAHPEHVRQGRVDENRQVDERKQVRRALRRQQAREAKEEAATAAAVAAAAAATNPVDPPAA